MARDLHLTIPMPIALAVAAHRLVCEFCSTLYGRATVLLMIYFTCFVISISASAQGLFGPEWTFTNAAFIREQTSTSPIKFKNRWIKKMLQRIRNKCSACRVVGHRVYLKDIWFQVGTDPFVIEVTASPLSEEDWIKHD